MNKRGISDIVASVLVILISVVAIGIVWVVIIPMVQESIEVRDLDARVLIVESWNAA